MGTPNRPASLSETSNPSTASEKKLFLSPHHESESSSYLSSSDSESESEGRSTGVVILKLKGMRGAFEASVCCLKCRGKITLREEIHRREGLCTHPYLFCQSSQSKTAIKFMKSSPRSLAINRRAVLAIKSIGGSYPSLETFCALLDI